MIINAGNVAAGPRIYTVAVGERHHTLEPGDTVIMVEAPNVEMWLFRTRDSTLHTLSREPRDEGGYVELSDGEGCPHCGAADKHAKRLRVEKPE